MRRGLTLVFGSDLADIEDGDLLRAQALTNTRDISSHRDITSENVVRRASEILAVAPSDTPLLLFAHLFDPHYDYIPPPPHDTRFDPAYTGSMNGENFYLNPAIWDAEQSPPRQISARDLEHVRALYQGEIAWTDQALGQLFDAWAEERDLDNTLIIVTSDHGEEFFEHGGRGHRHTLFDEVLRVPLLVVPPGGASAARRAQQVDLSDLLPTVLDYCGVETPAGVTGRSLRGLLEGADVASFEQRASLSSLLLTYQLGDEPLNYQLQDCLRTPQEKLVRVLTLDEERRRLVCERALWYDLVADPRERAPVTDREDPRLAAAWTRLEDELDSLRQLHEGEEATSRNDRGTAVRALFSGELGHLGYGDAEGASSVGLSMPWPPGPHPPVER